MSTTPATAAAGKAPACSVPRSLGAAAPAPPGPAALAPVPAAPAPSAPPAVPAALRMERSPQPVPVTYGTVSYGTVGFTRGIRLGSAPAGEPCTRLGSGSTKPAGDCRGVWRNVETLLGQPCIVEVRLGVAFATVAQERDDAAGFAALAHLVCQGQGAPDVRPRRGADAAAENWFECPCCGHRGSVGHRDHPFYDPGHEARLDSWPADALDARAAACCDGGVRGAPAGEERRILGVYDGEVGSEPPVPQIPADGCAGSAGPRADDDPPWDGKALQAHLFDDRFSDVVVTAPVGGPFGEGELIHVVAVRGLGEPDRLVVYGGRIVDEMAAATLPFDQCDLLATRRPRHHCHERKLEQPREVGLADRGGPGRCLDDRRAFVDLAVAEGVEEQGSGQPVLEGAGGMRRLVLEVQVDVGKRPQRHPDKVRVG